MSKIKILSSPINIPRNEKPIIQKSFLKKLDFETLDYIEDLYSQEKYDEIILMNFNIRIVEDFHPLEHNLVLEVLKYQICASFQLNNCNKAHNFILKANPFLSSNSEKILSFYESILQTLEAYDNNILILFEPTKSYLQSIISYIERLKEIVESSSIKEGSNNECLITSSENETLKTMLGSISCYED